MWHEPRRRQRYVVGADVAENVVRDRKARKTVVQYTDDRPDYSAAIVLEVETGQHMASWRGAIDPAEYATVLAAIGRYYDSALLIVEITGPGLGVMETLSKALRYENLYRTKLFNALVDDPLAPSFGWRTNSHTRPMLIQRIHEVLNSHMARTEDMELIDELRTMEFDEAGKARGRGKNKDDRALAYGLALQARYELLYGRVGEAEEQKDEDRLDGFERMVWRRARARMEEAQRRKHGDRRAGARRRPIGAGARAFGRVPRKVKRPSRP